MADTQDDIRYTVVVLSVPDSAARDSVARSLSQIARNLTQEQIAQKLDALPWTLTRSATRKTASTITDMLRSLGAEIKVIPPLPEKDTDLAATTQILPGTDLVSESQTIAATQYMPVPPELSETAGTTLTETDTIDTVTVAQSRAFSLEPLSLTGMLDRTFHICRRHFWKLFAIIGLPWLAMLGIIALGAAAFGIFSAFLLPMADGRGSSEAIASGALLLAPVGVVVGLFLFALFYMAQGALIHAVSSVYLGEPVRIKRAFGFVLSRLFKFIVTLILMAIVAMVLFVIPIVIAGVLYAVAASFTSTGWWSAVLWPFLAVPPLYAIPKLLLFDKAVIVEDTAYGAALKRSWELVSGKTDGPWPRTYYMRLIVLLHLYFVIIIGISMLFTPLSQIVILVLPKTGFWPVLSLGISQLLSALGNIVGTLFFTVCMVVFYYDIRIRKEGLDLRMLGNFQSR